MVEMPWVSIKTMGRKGANLDVEEPENVNQYRLLRISISFCVMSLISEKSIELGADWSPFYLRCLLCP